MKKTIKSLIMTFAAVLMTLSAAAQFTTSTMTGRIVDENGQTLPGATVVAVHTPSGSQYYAVTNVEGYYTIQGMRPGGPYEVSVSLVGCQTVKVNDITLSLSETYVQDAVLKTDSELLDEVIVVASANSKFSNEKTGASTNISNREMMNLPNSDHSMKNLTKLSPYSNGMSFAGSDGRSTNFNVDGANLNNNFGLSSNLPGGGTPISLDAIEEVQLVVAPYDVRQSNFVGGGINAITKSGTNTFKGTAYAYYNDQNLRGNKIDGADLGARAIEGNKIYGFTLGGPIIKNKLFFFVNFEHQNQPEEVIQYRADSEKSAVLEKVKNKLINDYGYDPGSITSYPGGTENTKILARVDWNISDNHHFSFRFNKTDSEVWNEPNGNSCDDQFRNKSFNRASEVSQPFSKNMYSQMNNVMSFAGELNSRFGNNIANRLIVTYTDINDMRDSKSDPFPHIDIMSGYDSNTKGLIPYTSFGYELFTYNNGVKNKVITAADDLTFYLGAHTFTAGLSYERQNASNAYMRNATGYYRFESVDDFLNGNLPISAAFCYGFNGNDSPNGEVTYNQIAAYAQDEWKISRKFKLTYGLRADTILFDDSQLMTNDAIKALSFGGRYIDTGAWPKTRVQVSPRIGFNWDVKGDKSLVVRGGTGFFQGRLPLVFFTNMPQNAGMIQNLVSKGNFSSTLNGSDIKMSDDVRANMLILNGGKETGGHLITNVKDMVSAFNLPTKITSSDGAVQSEIPAVDENFKMPQIWKTSIAVDYRIPVDFPFSVTAEAMFNKTLQGVLLTDWNINENSVMKDANRFAGPDNRINYKNIQSSALKYQSSSAYVLTNTNKGYGYIANITLNAEPVKNLKLMAAYTFTESKELSGMPGSNAGSAYSGLYCVNGTNFLDLQRSQYVVPHKVMANVSYFLPFQVFGGKGLHIDAFYTAFSGMGNSFIYSNDMNGDGNNSNDLIYIPANKEENAAMFASAEDAKAFWTFLNNDKYLRKHMGQYAEANAARSPWVHRVDLRIAEDFSFRVGNTKHNFQLSASIDNVGNLLNSKWGVTKMSGYQKSLDAYTIAPLAYEGAKDGRPQFSMVKVDGAYPTENYTKFFKNTSECWHILFGIKYFFN